MKKREFEKENVSDPNMHTRSPLINNGLTPYFQDSNPPIIDIRMPGIATNQTRVLAIVKVRENSSIKTGKIGGIACNEKIKENLVKKLTSKALVLLFFSLCNASHLTGKIISTLANCNKYLSTLSNSNNKTKYPIK
jgi:hypothetical protein